MRLVCIARLVCPYHQGPCISQRQVEKDEELLDQLPGQFAKSLSREVRLLQSLHHPNIIRLYQVVETEQEYYIITCVHAACLTT